jgi:hypothetical protein
VGENKPGNRFWQGRVVRYLSDSERAAHKLTFRDGKIYDASGKPFDTTAGQSLHPGGEGRAIFVMDEHGSFYASNFHAKGQFHHSSLAAGQPVAAAGELVVKDGVLKMLTDQSGHYWPTTDFSAQAIEALKRLGIDMSGVQVKLSGLPPPKP